MVGTDGVVQLGEVVGWQLQPLRPAREGVLVALAEQAQQHGDADRCGDALAGVHGRCPRRWTGRRWRGEAAAAYTPPTTPSPMGALAGAGNRRAPVSDGGGTGRRRRNARRTGWRRRRPTPPRAGRE